MGIKSVTLPKNMKGIVIHSDNKKNIIKNNNATQDKQQDVKKISYVFEGFFIEIVLVDLKEN